MGVSSKGVALVTGAARRLGKEISLRLAEMGYQVAVHYNRSEEDAQRVVDEIRERGGRASSFQAPLEDEDATRGLFSRTTEEFGEVRVLVNNASEFPTDGLMDFSWEALARSLKIHAYAPLVLTRCMAETSSRGAVVNLLDTRVPGADPKHCSYLLGKQALWSLTRTMALEMAPRFTVNAVAPGLILSPPGEDESYLTRQAELLPLKRSGTPSQVARAVGFLVGSPFVTGQIIYVDGGRHLDDGGP